MTEGTLLTALTWADVASLLRVSPRQARRVARRIGLVPVVLGHRTVRFRAGDVAEAMSRAGL
jgi:hypothetical protein